MRLSLHSVGGFTGPAGAQTRSVDTDQLPATEAQHLQGLVTRLDMAKMPASLMKARPQSSDFAYTLTVDDGAQQPAQQLKFHADAAPPALRELVASMEKYPLA